MGSTVSILFTVIWGSTVSILFTDMGSTVSFLFTDIWVLLYPFYSQIYGVLLYPFYSQIYWVLLYPRNLSVTIATQVVEVCRQFRLFLMISCRHIMSEAVDDVELGMHRRP